MALKMAQDIERKRSQKRKGAGTLNSESARRLLSSVRRNQASRLLTPKIVSKADWFKIKQFNNKYVQAVGHAQIE